MAIMVHVYGVVVKKTSVAERYPGGLAGFRRDWASTRFCEDAFLAHLAADTESEMARITERLEENDLRGTRGSLALDFVAVSGVSGPQSPCPWLQCNSAGGRLSCNLKGTPPCRPVDWADNLMSIKQVGTISEKRLPDGRILDVDRSFRSLKLILDAELFLLHPDDQIGIVGKRVCENGGRASTIQLMLKCRLSLMDEIEKSIFLLSADTSKWVVYRREEKSVAA